MESYVTVKGISSAQYTEKRSKFIAEAFPCESTKQAEEIIADSRKRYFDARHNVYAYVLADGTARFSDDGEPHGTAGKPMLDCIIGSGIVNVMVVVTRYFGGVLLGTGGLVKAYSTACADALSAAELTEYCKAASFSCDMEYRNLKTAERLVDKYSGMILSTDYGDKITLHFAIKTAQKDGFLSELCEAFASNVTAIEGKTDFLSFPVKK